MEEKNVKNFTENSSFGSRLRKLRKDKGLSQEELAKKIGYKRSGSISNIESDKTPPDILTLAKLTDVLSADLHWLITGQPSPRESAEIENYKKAVRRLMPYAEFFLSNLLRKREQPRKSAANLVRLHEEQEASKDSRYEYKAHLKNLNDILKLVEPKADKRDTKVNCDSKK